METPVAVYQFRVWIREISPMIWRRLLVRSDSTLADLHYVLQIALGWSDAHLHRFALRCRTYGIHRRGGLSYTADARRVVLADLHLRPRERFLYEYDFNDRWVLEVRLERMLPLDAQRAYPVCIGGARAGPPEECGGPWAYLAQRDQYTPFAVAEQVSDWLREGTLAEYREEVAEMCVWLSCDRFDRRATNRRLQLYVTGGEWWLEES
jgi:hypothetical protein